MPWPMPRRRDTAEVDRVVRPAMACPGTVPRCTTQGTGNVLPFVVSNAFAPQPCQCVCVCVPIDAQKLAFTNYTAAGQ